LQLFHLIILAVVQGLTEFLPVSSSGHLVLLEHWLGSFDGDIFLNVILHVGTLLAVLVVYAKDLRRLLNFDTLAVQYIVALAVATLPAVAVGLLLEDFITGLFGSPQAASLALIATGLILMSTRLIGDRNRDRRYGAAWEPVPPPLGKALLIGCAQAMAIMPGISRSGSTIAASIWLGLDREEAARFSFLMAVPAIAGALVLQLRDGIPESEASGMGLILGLFASFMVGLVAIRLTALLVVRKHFWKFSFYCLPLGVLMYFLLK
jgi:undecaprenyl-diphosphatase